MVTLPVLIPDKESKLTFNVYFKFKFILILIKLLKYAGREGLNKGLVNIMHVKVLLKFCNTDESFWVSWKFTEV